MPDFLLELLSEEIPARMQAKAEKDLASLFDAELIKSGLKAEGIETFSTPRRLTLIARGLPTETVAVSEELKGPRTSAPPQALEGFLRKTGLRQDQLVDRDGTYFAVIDKPGQATKDVLAEAIPAIVRAFPWPKSMRWGAASLSTESPRWVRPLQGIVALLGEEIVDFEVAGISSGAATVGHRFHHPGQITIGSANDYAEKLRACHVIVDPRERQQIIRDGAAKAARDAGLILVEDEGLVAENAGLTEWPVPLLGSFDPTFLDVPREVIQLTMRTNQKYFAAQIPPRDGEGDQPKAGGGAGTLAPNFICTANIDAADGGASIVAGNEKVLAARLSDAKFFWEQDLKIPLENQAEKLNQIVFHEKLGTVADKVDRVAKLARWLVEEGIIKPSPLQGRGLGEGESETSPLSSSAPADRPLSPTLSPEGERELLAQLAYDAARLCKADLVTGMVGEFPELQGLIGGYLARAQGHPDAVADAIRDHYKPVGQGDEVPTAPVTVAVSLADKLDSLSQFFIVNEVPTGSRDPFALRRAALGVLSLLISNEIRLPLRAALFEPLVHRAVKIYTSETHSAADAMYEIASEYADRQKLLDLYASILATKRDAALADRDTWFADKILGTIYFTADFLADRLKVQQREAGVRHDLIDAVFALGGEDDLVRLLARVKALQSFVETGEGTDLLAGYKRAANILKKEGWTGAEALTSTGSQGIPQTGEEDPLVLVEEPGVADAIAEMAHHHPKKPLSYTPEKEEADLIAALDAAEPKAAAAIEAEDFEGAMAALASLRAPVDMFFDKVTVNDPDPAKREARLNLLARMRDAVHRVADFSKIEG
ncbi:glycine--tRNA ligase subunit beta [Allosphingosinicella flava]|uniref:Glycine--tRNA ligase beta subunit n=1 Tax=Allosphingosinicella flava TaxID=2771430 RepID=A0A7T2GL75_9SPHN|nr:glycine--tRNA ligase subunit beta [Sphingosinicella flava]QPQ55906.1 glycine--tRNA ligase subunit beta [Sphingosinicella flava]